MPRGNGLPTALGKICEVTVCGLERPTHFWKMFGYQEDALYFCALVERLDFSQPGIGGFHSEICKPPSIITRQEICNWLGRMERTAYVLGSGTLIFQPTIGQVVLGGLLLFTLSSLLLLAFSSERDTYTSYPAGRDILNAQLFRPSVLIVPGDGVVASLFVGCVVLLYLQRKSKPVRSWDWKRLMRNLFVFIFFS